MDGEEREKELLKKILYYYDKKPGLPKLPNEMETFEDLKREIDTIKEDNKKTNFFKVVITSALTSAITTAIILLLIESLKH